MKLKPEQIEQMKNVSPQEFQVKYYKLIPKRLFNKLLAKNVKLSEAIDILGDYYRRGMDKDIELFIKFYKF